jgi:GTPase SAR1 family protein
VLPTYFQGSTVAALIYDITNRESFEKLEYWKELLIESVGKIPIIVVGNKTDLEEKRMVEPKEAEQFAADLKTSHFEVSAKEDNNLYPVFKKIIEIALEKVN